ncbi:peptidase [Synechococcus sp. CS-1324]|uniref:peptidase n=1 Tax=Synechococcus sp. CS-1324 TaxID=2847980 RepID=UPI000DB29087|nr:peptidase [Synechococcus sp. CS-1324]MCT0230758.1 peptidase [Synechococcus sp. CS-1324]PZV05909.1 MAG: peptidase [Cyanobium sp.]
MQALAKLRRWHGLLAPVVLAPLLVTVASGMSYRLLRDWAGFSRDQAHLLMVLHEGEWLGSQGETIYVALNGVGLLWMLATGAGLLIQKWSRRAVAGRKAESPPAQTEPES